MLKMNLNFFIFFIFHHNYSIVWSLNSTDSTSVPAATTTTAAPAVTAAPATPDAAEKRLMKYLFSDYDSLVRPRKDPNEPVNVTVNMWIESLADVNEKDGTVTISGWLDLIWRDDGMCWDPMDFGNISFFIAPVDKFWRPDIAFASSVGERFFSTEDQFMGVTSDCMLSVSPGGRSTHSCEFDMTLFPFDYQICTFVVETWISSSDYIRVEANNFSFSSRADNEIWKIAGAEAKTNMEDDPYGEVEFRLHITRKPLYFNLYVVAPLLMLSILNLMVFRVPPASGEKISLSITVLLAFSIWLLMLNDLTPKSSDLIPILGVLITLLMFLSAASTIMTVQVMRIHHRHESQAIPLWARRLVRLFKVRTSNNQVKNISEEDDEPEMSWPAVSEAVDSLLFTVVLSLTLMMIIACVFSCIILKYQ